jgi:hypothetical protein
MAVLCCNIDILIIIIVTLQVGGATGGGGAAASPFGLASGNSSRGQYTPGPSSVLLERGGGAKVKLVGGQQEASKASRNIFNKTFDFGQMGIGGLDNEFNQVSLVSGNHDSVQFKAVSSVSRLVGYIGGMSVCTNDVF